MLRYQQLITATGQLAMSESELWTRIGDMASPRLQAGDLKGAIRSDPST